MIGSLPIGRVDVVTVATPLTRVEVPSGVAPLVKVTVPVTVAESVSVNVTESPNRDGFFEEVNVDVGEAFATVCVVVPVAEA